jgi:hypothetical protein
MEHPTNIVAIIAAMLPVSFGGIASAAAPIPIEDYLAGARSGALQCFGPDTTKKTCGSIDGFTFDADGNVIIRGQVIISATPPVVITEKITNRIVNGQLCATAKGDESDTATFTISGQPASEERTVKLRAFLKKALASAVGRVGCASYTSEGGEVTRHSFLDGAPLKASDGRVIWVRPEDDYTIDYPPKTP